MAHTADFVLLDRDEAAGYRDQGKKPITSHDQKKLVTWLEPTDYLGASSEFIRQASFRTPGTLNWFRQSPSYQTWRASPSHGGLWINAGPGSGKSVLAATIVKELRETADCPVLFFFFRKVVLTNHTPKHLAQDWLAQLLPFSVSLQHDLKKRVDEGERLGDLLLEDLWRLLFDGLENVERCFCVVDALDEMDAGESLKPLYYFQIADF